MSLALPTEIWQECWSYMPRKQLKRLSLVCPLFRDICQSIQFRRLVVSCPPSEDVDRDNWKSLTWDLIHEKARFHAISSNPRLARMVREWTFHGTLGMHFLAVEFPFVRHMHLISDHYDAAVEEFAATLHRYPNLAVLDMSGVVLSRALRRTICTLRNLRSLHFAGCEIVGRRGPTVELERFSFVGFGWPGTPQDSPQNLIAPSKLQSLIMSDPNFVNVMLPSFAGVNHFPRLTELVLRLPANTEALFYPFIDRCPELRTIDIRAPADYADGALAHSTAPFLRVFKGPVALALQFVPGRPVWKIELRSEQKNHFISEDVLSHALVQISNSSATVHSIVLPAVVTKTNMFRLISQHFTKLHKLTLTIRNEEEAPSADDDELEDSDDSDDSDSGIESDDDTLGSDEDSEENRAVEESAGIDHNSNVQNGNDEGRYAVENFVEANDPDIGEIVIDGAEASITTQEMSSASVGAGAGHVNEDASSDSDSEMGYEGLHCISRASMYEDSDTDSSDGESVAGDAAGSSGDGLSSRTQESEEPNSFFVSLVVLSVCLHPKLTSWPERYPFPCSR